MFRPGLFSLLSAAIATAAPGDMDASFSCTPNAAVNAMALRADGKIVIGGAFSLVNGTAATGIAVIRADGSHAGGPTDVPYHTTGIQPLCFAAAVDGSMVMGLEGPLAPMADATATTVHRFAADGLRQKDFTSSHASSVASLAFMKTGSIFAVGWNGSNTSHALLLPTGGPSGYDFVIPNAGRTNSTIVRVEDDSRIFGGTAGNGFSHAYLPEGGTPIPLPGTHQITRMLEDADGSLVLAGSIQTDTGGTKRPLARISATGAILASWTLNSGASISQIGIQGDGRILIARDFTSVNGTARTGLARLLRTGGVDTTISWPMTGKVKTFLHLPDGSILAAGDIKPSGQSTARPLVKFQNDPGSIAIQTTSTEVRLAVTGTAPIPGRVSFFMNRGETPKGDPLAVPVWSDGAWRVTGLAVPDDAAIVAETVTNGGTPSAMALLKKTKRTDALPVISLKAGATTYTGGSAHLDLGQVPAGWKMDLPFTLRNDGWAPLDGLTITPEPGMPGTSQTTLSETSVPPGFTSALRIAYTPQQTGEQTAAFRVSGNDPATPPFFLYLHYSTANTVDFTFRAAEELPFPTGPANGPFIFGKLRPAFTLTGPTILRAVNFPGTTPGIPLAGLPEGAIVPVTSADGSIHQYTASYRGGDGNDLVFTLIMQGAVDAAFSSGAAEVNAIIPGPQGTSWVAAIHGGSVPGGRTPFAKLLADGSPAASFSLPPELRSISAIFSAHVLPSGKILITGAVDVQSTFKGVAMLLPDGSLDPSFHTPTMNAAVTDALVQADGRIIIGGYFGTVNGTARPRIARLMANGSLDTSFAPPFSAGGSQGPVRLLEAPDGRILAAMGNRVLRLDSAGNADPSYGGNLQSTANDISLLADGSLLVGGAGPTLTRLDADGSQLEQSSVTGNTYSSSAYPDIIVQEDGRVLVNGQFSKLYGQPRKGLGRLLADGTVDPAFDPQLDFGSSLVDTGSAAIGWDGRLLAAGPNLRRVDGGPLAEITEIQPAGRLRWQRGAAPLAHKVVFESRLPGSATWTALGQGTRTAEGWVLENAILPPQASIRGRAFIRTKSGGYDACSLFPSVGAPTVGTLSVTGGCPGAPLQDGATLAPAPASLIRFDRTVLITLRNSGTAPLTGITYALSGPQAADYRLGGALPSSLPAGETVELPLIFRPATTGTSSARLRITSDDPATPAINLQLAEQGTDVISPHFPTPTSTAFTSATFDPSLYRLGPITFGFAPTAGLQVRLLAIPYGSIGSAAPFIDAPAVVDVIHAGKAYPFAVIHEAGGGILLRARTTDTRDTTFAMDDAAYNFSGSALALLPDARYIACTFSNAPFMMRFSAQGVRESFSPAVIDFAPACITLLPDGRHLLPGTTTVNPQRLLRLDANSVKDTIFNPGFTGGSILQTLALRDGRILVSGSFTAVNGTARPGLVLLKADGTVDTTFNPPSGLGASNALAQQPDGRLLVAGGSSGSPAGGLNRLRLDGTVEARVADTYGALIRCIAMCPDGRFFIGGEFFYVNEIRQDNFAAFKADGTRDPSYTAIPNGQVECILPQTDGGVLIGGAFTSVGFASQPYLARILPGGSLDATYTPVAGARITALLNAPDGRFIATRYAPNSSDSGILAFYNEVYASSVEVTSGRGIFWKRNALSAELSHASFEIRATGQEAWTPIGDATRTADGWQILSASLPATGQIRISGRQASSNTSAGLLSEIHDFTRLDVNDLELWRHRAFGYSQNTGDAANTADPDGDGLNNLCEYALGLNPRVRNPGADMPLLEPAFGGYRMTFIVPAEFPVDYAAEWSTTLRENDWHAAEDHTTYPLSKEFRAPRPAGGTFFMRLKFTTR